jgi:hypothetical protein
MRQSLLLQRIRVESAGDGGVDVAVGLLCADAGVVERGVGVVRGECPGSDHAGHAAGGAVQRVAAPTLGRAGDRIEVGGE